MKRIVTILAVLAAFGMAPSLAAETKKATVYKSPECGCCGGYVEYLQKNGFAVDVKNLADLTTVKRLAGVPPALEACHTTMIEGYVVEGHVPMQTLHRLLTEKPKIRGIALPGMPDGSPGMSGQKKEPFTIYELTGGEPKVYAVE